jgi:lipoprotein signal peptidase
MKIKLFIAFCLLSTGYLNAQDTVSINNYEKASFNKAYFKSYITDTKDIIVAPFHWNGKQWITAGAVVTSTVVLLPRDKPVYDVIQKNRNSTLDNLSKYVFEPWGNKYAFGLTAGFYFEGLIFKNERNKKVAMEATKSIIITTGFTQVTKYLIQRHRPYQDEPPDPYKAEGPFHGKSDYTSFFSGHTSTIFALATTFSMEFKEQKWVPYVAYSIATGVAWSRLYDNQHWASDVFAGAAAGYFIGRLIHKKNNWGISIV